MTRSAVLLLLTAGCRTSGPATGSNPAGIATAFDSTADTVFARVRGTVPESAVRRLVEEVRIAPSAEDTTLFTEVSGFEVDRAGRFWVFDRPSNSILLFSPAGRLLRRIGRQGGGPGEFKNDAGMAVLGDSGLAIWDSQNARVSFFTAAGDFRTSWITPAGFSTNNGLVTDRSGALLLKRPVTPPREGEILGRMGLVRLKAGGAFGDSLVPPDLPVPRDVYVATRIQGKDNRSQSSTSSDFGPRYFWGWHPEGFFVVAHGGSYEIVVTRPGSKPLAIRRVLPAVAISEQERNEEHTRILWSMRNTDPSWSWSGPPIPDAKAPMAGLVLARDGRIWAEVAMPSEPIPEAELSAPREHGPPDTHFRTPVVYEVFGADGHFLGRVSAPSRRWRLIEADGDTVWALLRGENDLPAVVRFRIEPGLR